MFSAADVAGARHVAVINERFAARYFGSENPIGRTVTLSKLATGTEPVPDPTFQIVGVVGDYINRGIRRPIEPGVLIPTTIGGGRRILFVRTTIEPALVAAEVRRQVWALSPAVAMSMPVPYEKQLNAAYAQSRFSTLILGVFAVAGLLLVAVGVYGVMSYGVARRTQEIAIRVALGGERRHVLRLILRQGLTLVAAGIGAGLLLSIFVTRIVRANWADPMNMPTDQWTTAAAVAVIVAIGALACYWPARRALHVDPLVALRRE
jgi:putative ABC transport system permease protein